MAKSTGRTESAADAPLSGADLLARIKPRLAETKTQLCLRPDLLEAWEEANDDLEKKQADDQASQRLASGSSSSSAARKLAQKVQQIEAEIEASAVWFRFRAMPKDEWQALCAEYPPRKGDQFDVFAGYNRDAVVDAMVRVCMIDPIFIDCPRSPEDECTHDDCGSWQAFLKVCNPSEWNNLRDTVQRVNQGVVDAPKSELASRILRRRASDSKPPAPGE